MTAEQRAQAIADEFVPEEWTDAMWRDLWGAVKRHIEEAEKAAVKEERSAIRARGDS